MVVYYHRKAQESPGFFLDFYEINGVGRDPSHQPWKEYDPPKQMYAVEDNGKFELKVSETQQRKRMFRNLLVLRDGKKYLKGNYLISP